MLFGTIKTFFIDKCRKNGHSPEFLDTLVQCDDMEELIEETASWVRVCEGNAGLAAHYILLTISEI